MQYYLLKRKLTIKDIINILNSEKDIDKLVMSEGTYHHLPKRALKSLRQMGIKLEVVQLKRGRESKVKERIKKHMSLPAKQISKKEGIPLRTVYYHLKKLKSDKE
ncbi:MAG: hypothetical protein QW112_00030 [Candidatus Micrarchaeia archaeon]